MKSSRTHLAIIIPTYNEATNVAPLLKSLKSVTAQQPSLTTTVFIVDDSSPDGTAELVRRITPNLTSRTFDIHLIVRAKKSGLGSAYVHGITHILKLKKTFDYILQMDADLSHDTAYIHSFVYQARQATDIVVASRYIAGGGTPDWSWYRKILSLGGNIYTRTFLGSQVTDYTGGFNMYSTRLLRQIDFNTIASDGYGFQIELKHRALAHTSSVAEIPIIFIDRQHGHSKIPRNTLIKNLILVPKIRFTKNQ